LRLKDNPSPDPAQCGKPTALGTPFLEDGELGWETIRDYFFDFSQKIKDGEEK